MKDATRDALVELAPPLIVFSVGCLVAACLVILPGCTEEDNQRAEIMRLHGVIKMMSDEATRVSKTLPSEQPALLAELDAAKKRLVEMRDAVEASKILRLNLFAASRTTCVPAMFVSTVCTGSSAIN
jgi:hypothetical protein